VSTRAFLAGRKTCGVRFLAMPFIVALFAHSASPQEKNGFTRHFPVTDPKNFTRVVATVGDIDVTAQEFLLSYEFGPGFAKRVKESRQRYLEFMVNEKLLALDARAHGLRNSVRVTRSLEELEGDMATEELFKDDVLRKVSLTQSEIERGMREGRVHYQLQWLFASGPDEAAALQTELNRGTPYDTLFARQIRGDVKRDDRSMESTLFKLRRANPVLASVAETLRAGRISEPVRGPDGYYIIRVADGWRDMTLSATESQKLLEDARRALTGEKSDSLSDRYVRRMMLEHDPVIIRRTFDRLQAWLGGIWVTPDRLAGWSIAEQAGRARDSAAESRIDRFGRDTLVSIKRGGIRLDQFLSWYRARDTYFRLNTATEKTFFISVEDLVWRMVRDRLLVDRAIKRNLQERDPVKKQLRWWEEKILYGEEKTLLGSSIVLSDSACRAYYDSNSRDYRRDSAGVQPFERVKDQVRKDYFTFELKKNMLHRITALKRKYPVVVKNDVLMSLPLDVENNPKAIDVYMAKKGGTFPHPAFPVIDFEWATWM
jgi:hypothetical protein